MSKRKKKGRGGQKRTSSEAEWSGDEARPGFFARRGTLVVWVMMGVYCAVFITFSLIKYAYFLYNDFDLAIFSQAAYTTIRGSLYNSILGMNYLGSHMSLLMFLVAPIYGVFGHPVTLLVLQTVVLALGALPVYWLARRELKNAFVAVCFAALYLLYPALGYGNLYEFHPVTLTTTTLLFAFYFLWVGRFGWMVLFAVLSLMGKENVPLVVMMMGVYSLRKRGQDPFACRPGGCFAQKGPDPFFPWTVGVLGDAGGTGGGLSGDVARRRYARDQQGRGEVSGVLFEMG
ncbi:MAG: hypothetical protein AMS16_04300 [Planctomycetes bacterium DG_58]|nr:MAG: hypothetical protein AMS16_04300 [Planctomycetes bacterium DG_58]